MERNWTRITVVWMALTFMAVSGFWLIWNIIAGEIPAVKEVLWFRGNEAKKTADVIYSLAFPISRAWDAFLAPLFVFAFLRLWQYAKKKEAAGKEGTVSGLVFGLVSGLVFGSVVGLAFRLVVGSVAGLAIGLAYGVMVSLGFGAVIGWAATLTIWLPLLVILLLVLAGRLLLRSIRSFNTGAIRELLTGQ